MIFGSPLVANLWGWLGGLKLHQLIFGVLALGFLLMSLYTFSLRYELKTKVLQHDKETVIFETNLRQLTLERDEYKRSFLELRDSLAEVNKENAEAYAKAQKENADAMVKLRADQLKSDKSQTKQLQVIQNQDAVCKAALESLDTYCKGVGEL